MLPNSDDVAVVRNVVVVEDDPLTRLAVEVVFVDDPRFRVCWHAGSLTRALELAAKETREIDLVVLDDVLEGRAWGAELAPLLTHLWPSARVVLFSADPDGAAAPGVDAAVAKTQPERLLATARALLGLAPPAPAAARPAAGSRPRRGRPRRPGRGRPRAVSPFAFPARLAAAAAAVVALLATAGVPAPQRLVAEAVGFAGRLVPGPSEPDRSGGAEGSARRGRGEPAAPSGTEVRGAEEAGGRRPAAGDGDGDGDGSGPAGRPVAPGGEQQGGGPVPAPGATPRPPSAPPARPGGERPKTPSRPAGPDGGDGAGRPAPGPRPSPAEPRRPASSNTTTTTVPATTTTLPAVTTTTTTTTAAAPGSRRPGGGGAAPTAADEGAGRGRG